MPRLGPLPPPERRRRSDVVATVGIVVVLAVAVTVLWVTSRVANTASAPAATPVPLPPPVSDVPAAFVEAWRAPSGATKTPVVAGPVVVTGEGGTVAVAGHRTTYGAPFRRVDDLERGDRLVMRMPYGRLTYRVERKRIVDPSATWVVRDVGHEQLVLTACHPLYSAEQRIVVFARLERA